MEQTSIPKTKDKFLGISYTNFVSMHLSLELIVNCGGDGILLKMNPSSVPKMFQSQCSTIEMLSRVNVPMVPKINNKRWISLMKKDLGQL